MRHDKKLTALLLLLLSIHGVAILAGFFSPYSYRERNREVPLAAPTKLRWVDRSGRVASAAFGREPRSRAAL